MNPKLWWYVARAGGLTAWWLVSISVLWGLLLSTRVTRGRPTPAWLLDLHRFLGGLALVFTGVHIGGLVADTWTHFGWTEILVPFASTWRPDAVAWGVVAFYVLVAVEVTSLLMRRIPRRWWRLVHRSSFILFAVGTAHAFTAGTEADNPAVQWTGLLLSVAFLFLLTYRVVVRKPRPTTVRPSPVAARAARSSDRNGDVPHRSRSISS